MPLAGAEGQQLPPVALCPAPPPHAPLPSVLEWQAVGFRTTFPPTSRFVCTLSVTLPSHLRGNLELLGKG